MLLQQIAATTQRLLTCGKGIGELTRLVKDNCTFTQLKFASMVDLRNFFIIEKRNTLIGQSQNHKKPLHNGGWKR